MALAVAWIIALLVAAGIDSIAFNGAAMNCIRDRARPAAVQWQRAWRHLAQPS